jgi:stalled ribosome rescue protein Dom34
VSAPHAAVWLNAEEARIFRFGEAGVEKLQVNADGPGEVGGKVRDDREYFEAILAELTEVEDWMVAGPQGPRQDFEKYVRVGHAEALARKLVAVETMDEPHEGELLRHAKRHLSR